MRCHATFNNALQCKSEKLNSNLSCSTKDSRSKLNYGQCWRSWIISLGWVRHFCQAPGSGHYSDMANGKAGCSITLTSNRLVTLTHDCPLATLTIWSQVSHTSRLSTGWPRDHYITPWREKNDECEQCNPTWSQVSHTNTSHYQLDVAYDWVPPMTPMEVELTGSQSQ